MDIKNKIDCFVLCDNAQQAQQYATQFINEDEVAKVFMLTSDDINGSEKIAEDRERKRIAREIHDTLGHALTGISAGIDAVKVLVDIDTNRAKEQLNNVSVVVRDGIRDVRGSLNKMRPGALENNTLKEALIKIIREYEAISNLEIHLRYEWDNIDLDIAKEGSGILLINEDVLYKGYSASSLELL